MNVFENKAPLVSVIITTFNRRELLERAYQSVLNQSYSNIEIIIVDDCSTDDTLDYLNSIKEENTIIILNNVKKGVQYNRNAGILRATGKFVVGLDDDDYFHPKRIETMVNNYNSKYSFIGTLVQPVGVDIKVKCKEILGLNDILYHNNGFHWPLVLKKRMVEVGLFDLKLSSAQDYDMWIRLIKKYGKAKIVQKKLYYLDTRESSRISTDYEKKVNGRLNFLNKHKGIMTNKHYNYHKYYLEKIQKKDISVIFFIKNVPIKFWRKEFGFVLYSRFGFLKK